MKLYLKGFYGYKNFGDETILFGLLNYLQKEYNPESFVVEVGELSRIQHRVNQNKKYLDNGILDKMDFVENSIMSKRFRQLQIFLGLDKYRKYFKVFGGGEVLDESRKFPHDGWNLMILYRHDIRHRNFILTGGIGADHKTATKKMFKYLLQKTQKVICREKTSYERCQKYKTKSALLYQDFSKDILSPGVVANLGGNTANQNTGLLRASQGQNGLLHYVRGEREIASLRSQGQGSQGQGSQGQGSQGQGSQGQQKTILINISPKHFNENSLEKIQKFILKYPDHKKIFFPADINFDKNYYTEIRKIIPDLEMYDWTKHTLSDTISLFQFCDGGIGSRLHFLYPLKLFNKDFVSISNSDKIKKML